MISNSVTHLWIYTNTAIVDIVENSAAISPKTPNERRYCHAVRRCLRIECQYHRIKWQVFECSMMFHNVLRVFHDVLLVVHNVLQVFDDVLLCLTKFYDV